MMMRKSPLSPASGPAMAILLPLCLATVVALAVPACASASGEQAQDQAAVKEEDTLYSLGLVLAERLGDFNLTAAEIKLVQEGMTDGVLGRPPRVSLEIAGPKIEPFRQSRMRAAASVEKQAAQGFLDAAAKVPGALRTDSGLIYQELLAGEGAKPGPTDQVRLHYHGTFRDGQVFDSSVQGGEPVVFALNAVVPCFSEGIQRMQVGGKAKLTCPAALAYGDRGNPPKIPGGAALAFEVQLFEIVKP